MQGLRLNPVSYVVLGFVDWTGEATPYLLKQLVAQSVGNFWTLQHAQLYTEPERLAAGGYLTERRERGGRRPPGPPRPAPAPAGRRAGGGAPAAGVRLPPLLCGRAIAPPAYLLREP